MKVLARLGISVLMILVLTVGVSYGQSPGEEFYNKGIEYAAEGKFKEAKIAFEKVIKDDPFYSSAEFGLKTIEDVIGQKIESDTAIHFFKGIAYGNKGMIDEAITEISKAIEINPRYADAYSYKRGRKRGRWFQNNLTSEHNRNAFPSCLDNQDLIHPVPCII